MENQVEPNSPDQSSLAHARELSARTAASKTADAPAADLLKVLDRSQARIEFSLDGRVLFANENFLRIFGYEAEEIVGVHHSIFVEPAFAASGEYNAFWSRLNRGEALAGRFCRLEKQGREIWIQASYNPVMGDEGRPVRVVKLATDITEQEVFARDARNQLEAISRSQAVAEFDMDGRILAANANFCQMTGYSQSELLGQRHAMLVATDHMTSDDYREFWAALRRGEFQKGKFQRVAKGARLLWMHAAYTPILDGMGRPIKVVKFATDITQTENLSCDAKGQLQAISRSAAIIEFLPNGTILSANENFCSLFGYDLSELRARHHALFVSPSEAASDAYCEFWRRLAAGEYQSAKYARIAKDGRVVWIQASYNPVLDENGRVAKVVKYASDISAQVRQREEETENLRSLNRSLEAARHEAERAARAKSEFLATMSHEIRTPMNGVLGMLEVALSGEKDPTKQDYLTAARDSAWSLLGILNDILDYSKIEAGHLHLDVQAFSARQVIADLASTLGSKADEKGLDLLISIADEVPDWISGDPLRFRQVITNLLGNSIKFTERGSVRLDASYTLEGDSSRIRLSISDTGIGIDESAQRNLFQRFSQADASVMRRFGGTGLGLAICRELVQRMGGQIGVMSTLGVGSTFWFEIPAKPETKPIQRSTELTRAVSSTQAARILIAEDHPVNRKLLRSLLAPLGHDLTFVENGDQALQAADASAFDLILMDVSMPIMDGPTAARAIRARHGASANTPIIALTANAMPGDREEYLSAGMDDYLAKPFAARDLVEVMDRYIANGVSPDREILRQRPLIVPALSTPEHIQDADINDALESLDAWIQEIRGAAAA